MRLEFPFSFIEEILKEDKYIELTNFPEFQFYWEDRHKARNVIIDTSTSKMSFETVLELHSRLENEIKTGEITLPYDRFKSSSLKKNLSKISRHNKLGSKDDMRINLIKDIPSLFENFFAQNNDIKPYFVFFDKSSGNQRYLLTEVRFNPKTKYSSAYTQLSFIYRYFDRAKITTISIDSFNRRGSYNFDELLDELNIELCSDEINQEFDNKLLEIEKISKLTGKVFDANEFYLYASDLQELDKEMTYSRLNADDLNLSKLFVLDLETFTSKKLSSSSYGRDSTTERLTEYKPAFRTEELEIPRMTLVAGYHLDLHAWIVADYEDIVEHKFNGEGLMNKLILDDKDKELINMLIEQSKLQLEDIVSGKGGGAFTVSIGPPGTGKTLTAEVCSEVLELPLYKIQCSQLGLNPVDIEKRFNKILEYSEKWNAILLIDEADVYVRERGLDIQHNAIVGAMLRMLEKANTVIFMTSNIEQIDDAIKSRATAIVRYKYPEETNLIKIIDVLFEQYKIKAEFEHEDLATSLIEKYKTVSGRDIKQLCKLSKMRLSHLNKEKLDLDTAEFLFTYIK